MTTLLVNHLWQSTLFILAIAAIVRLFRRDSARVRYWLWFAASLKLLVPFSLLTALGALFATPALAPSELPALVMLVAVPLAEPPPSALATSLIAIWACGFSLVLLRWLAAARRIRHAIQDSTAASDFDVAVPQALSIRLTRSRIEPGVVGIAQPVLLLPEGIENALSRAEIAAVIEHELAHLRRRDNLTATIHMITEAVFWFHPLVWWVGARLIEERERACDEAVLAAGHDPAIYAESILNVCELYVESPMPCAAGVSGGKLAARIGSIMEGLSMTSLHVSKRLVLSAAVLAVFAVPIVVGLTTLGQPGLAIAQDRTEFLPIVVVAPEYPEAAAEQGLEGHVVIEFVVTTTGSTRDIMVVDSSSPLFEQAAIDAATKFKYQPRIVDGVPVEVPGVRTKVAFVLEKPSDERAGEAFVLASRNQLVDELVASGLARSDSEAIIEQLMQELDDCGNPPLIGPDGAITTQQLDTADVACWLDAMQKAGLGLTRPMSR